MRRVACLAFTELRLELANEKATQLSPESKANFGDSVALGVVISRLGSAVETELDVSGTTRLDVVSRKAKARGVRVGETVAAARAKCGNLCLRVVPEDSVRSALIRVAEAALAFGTATAFCLKRDVVWVEISGCAHLYGGERALALSLERHVRGLGYRCRTAIADGPRIAAAMARFSLSERASEIEIVPEQQGAAAVGALPTAALELNEDVNEWLSTLGLHTCSSLQSLPRQSFGIRLGAQAPDVFAMLTGDDCAPLAVWHPPEVPEERIELEWGTSSLEALTFIIKTLCDRLAVRLEGRGCAVSCLELSLVLDRALCDQKANITPQFAVALPVPLARSADLLAVVRARLERETLAAPALIVTLKALKITDSSERQALALFEPVPKADMALPRLIAELTAELGSAGVGTLALVDTWIPERRTKLISFGSPGSCTKNPLTVTALEPSRLIPTVRVSAHSFRDIELLGRIEGVEWWQSDFVRRDVVAGWLDSNETGSGVLAWLLLVEGDRDAHLCGWID
jgi:protein ImuB